MPGQHEVEDDEVRALALDERARRVPVTRLERAVALAPQVLARRLRGRPARRRRPAPSPRRNCAPRAAPRTLRESEIRAAARAPVSSSA